MSQKVEVFVNDFNRDIALISKTSVVTNDEFNLFIEPMARKVTSIVGYLKNQNDDYNKLIETKIEENKTFETLTKELKENNEKLIQKNKELDKKSNSDDKIISSLQIMLKNYETKTVDAEIVDKE